MVFAGGVVVWTVNSYGEFIKQVHRNVASETNPLSGHWKVAVETAALPPPPTLVLEIPRIIASLTKVVTRLL